MLEIACLIGIVITIILMISIGRNRYLTRTNIEAVQSLRKALSVIHVLEEELKKRQVDTNALLLSKLSQKDEQND